jgi:hypothetical protein
MKNTDVRNLVGFILAIAVALVVAKLFRRWAKQEIARIQD